MSWWAWLLPLVALTLFAPYSTDIDLSIAGHYYHNGQFSNDAFYQFLYTWGERPGLLMGGCAILVWVSTFFTDRWMKWRKAAWALTLAFVIGAGFLVNGVFKELWGRPRPCQVEQFGGTATYRPFYQPDFHHHGYGYKSFPSGHVSMGFFFLTLALVGRREHSRTLFWLGLAAAFLMGILLAITRMAQGGHFFSDTVFAAVIMWWMAIVACRIAYGPEISNSPYVK